MTNLAMNSPTEDELDILVSIGIRRAELLAEIRSPMVTAAWSEVMAYEEQLARITLSGEIAGGIARAGAVMAALAAGRRADAHNLATQYLADDTLPAERKGVISA